MYDDDEQVNKAKANFLTTATILLSNVKIFLWRIRKGIFFVELGLASSTFRFPLNNEMARTEKVLGTQKERKNDANINC